jgi:hypothetical protein
VRTVALYLAAGIVWVAIGVFVPDFMLSWPVTIVYLLVAVWLLPLLVGRVAPLAHRRVDRSAQTDARAKPARPDGRPRKRRLGRLR